MLGHKAAQVLSQRFDVYATFRDPQGLWRHFPMYANAAPERLIAGVNAQDFHSVVRALGMARPDVVINCIGIIKQLKAASDPVTSLTINALFPHQLADLCGAAGARLFHVSTDCVFSGRKGHYTEADLTDAEDLYGRSKLLGELDRPGCLTLRTSIIGREFTRQTGLLEWFLSQRGRSVRGYKNAIYTGFPTQVLARILGDLIVVHPALAGLYQVASPAISKYDLLVKLRAAMNLAIEIEPYDDPPCDRSLSAARFVAATGYRIPTWNEMVAELAADSTPYEEWRSQHGIA
jgi:dTDP-4-dehydrorhamnose reductase